MINVGLAIGKCDAPLPRPGRPGRAHPRRGRPAGRLDFGAPEPVVVEAIVRGTSPILRALDAALSRESLQ
jgi:hypothetical protein